MGMPFATAATGTPQTESAFSYADIIAEIDTSVPGHETAANVFYLFKHMQKDKLDFCRLLQVTPSPKLQHLLEDTNRMVEACKSSYAMYFYPDEKGEIGMTSNEHKAHEAWMQAQQRVYQFAVGAAYSDFASRSHG